MIQAVGELMQRLRIAAVNAVSEDDVRAIFQALVEKAKRGDLQAARMLFSWVLPQQPIVQITAPQPRSDARHRVPRKLKEVLALEHRNGQATAD